MGVRTISGLLLACALLPACALTQPVTMPVLAEAEVAADFHSYSIRRVGLLPFAGHDVPERQSQALQRGLYIEIDQSTPFEVVLLTARDLQEVEESQPHRRGWYQPRTIIELSRRFNLDAILFGTVTQQRFYPPQSIGLQVDMVAAETGQVVWSSSVALDASDPRVIDGLKAFYTLPEDNLLLEEESEDWELALLSPERFARFAAYQIAQLL